ncbi:MAG TPA: NAD-dependent epimerase/dehydratase family protein [Sphingobacteriaceae bacterium]|nr:NAD-dependent epimerase/dehydratase family protein [Sphingobacteriaceae bacterium]
MSETIIIIGSNGQIGTELAISLRKIYGSNAVITADIRPPKTPAEDEQFMLIDVLDKKKLHQVFKKYKPTQIYLLAAMLSATGEKHPRVAWELNMDGLFNVFDLAVEFGTKKVFWPSSIAVFGPNSPRKATPQYSVMDPNTIYGISKLAGERFCEYYHSKYSLDVRSIRYPGLISWKTAPGGGTTDYAVEIFHAARKEGKYESFLSANTALPMLYMEDAIRGTIQLMQAPADKILQRSSYNMGGLSFSPSELGEAINRHLPEFKLTYKVNDPRQAIADSWPASIDDSEAQKDWGWKPAFDLDKMVEEMLLNIK